MAKNKILFDKRIYLPLLLACFPLSSCTPEKAKALRLGAVQFQAESLACVSAINTMHLKELEPPPRTSEEISQEFVENILSSDSPQILPSEVDFALDPYAPPAVGKKWQEFTDKLTAQYTSFANIYDDLEQGSFTATESVKRSAKFAEDLTIQMAGFTEIIIDNPPVLLQYRSDIATNLTKLKDKYQNSISSNEDQEIRSAAIDLLAQWQQVKIQEEELKNATVKQCLQASVMGKELRQLIEDYDQLDLDVINTIISGIFDTVGSIAGKDFSALKQQSSNLIAQIKDDEILGKSAEKILNEVKIAVESRNIDSRLETSIESDKIQAAQGIDISNDQQIFAELNNLIKATKPKNISQVPSPKY